MAMNSAIKAQIFPPGGVIGHVQLGFQAGSMLRTQPVSQLHGVVWVIHIERHSAPLHAFHARKRLNATLQPLQVNLPGTREDQFPNWRRKLGPALEALADHPGLQAVVRALARRSWRAP